MISLITEKEEWRNALKAIGGYDFYHTYDYHHLSKNADETPLLVMYKDEHLHLVIPFLKRTIADGPYVDLTSVYGYAGPLQKGTLEDADLGLFQTMFNSCLAELKVVSIFSRLHPYLNYQEPLLAGLGQVITLGKTVNIDLTKSVDEQRTQYGKSTKNRTNKCRRLCKVVSATTTEDIDTFIDIYYENMKRLSAAESYFFPRKYFFDFLECSDFETDILLVIHEEDQLAIAGSMFVKTNSMVQFHLSGSRTEYLNIAPANLFLDEMRLKATQEGYTTFNLGGGLGSEQDSLFNFKASFSKDYRDFKIWKYIVNNSVYDTLAGERKHSDFFPAYRATS